MDHGDLREDGVEKGRLPLWESRREGNHAPFLQRELLDHPSESISGQEAIEPLTRLEALAKVESVMPDVKEQQRWVLRQRLGELPQVPVRDLVSLEV